VRSGSSDGFAIVGLMGAVSASAMPGLNCTIINIGDALMQWTDGVLLSSFHRALRLPGV
jgi:isopenicillin N synthase-like dioxygenase